MTDEIDLNCDLGESYGAFVIGDDAGIMPYISSANIACGFHAGDPTVIRRAVRLATKHGVAIGAHPAYPDLVGFGLRRMDIDAGRLEDLVLYQIAAVAGIASAENAELHHVKPHGALYNMAARDAGLAHSVVGVVKATLPGGRLVGPPASQLEQWARRQGVGYVREGFADRAYERDGSLRSRDLPGALLAHGEAQARRAVSLAVSGEVETHGGEVVALRADTICLHGDSPGALDSARAIRDALKQAGVALCPPA